MADEYQLIKTNGRVELHAPAGSPFKPLFIDFLSGAAAHRRAYGGGRSQLLAKAVGAKKPGLSVIDATAGLGQDAFVLACLGCEVTMIERSPLVHALLEDALRRLKESPEGADLSLSLVQADAIKYLSDHRADVVYLDPMYPDERGNTALPKKEMQILKEITGPDEDIAELLKAAKGAADKRVVLKRPAWAAQIEEPDLVYKGESTRFEVWVPAQFDPLRFNNPLP